MMVWLVGREGGSGRRGETGKRDEGGERMRVTSASPPPPPRLFWPRPPHTLARIETLHQFSLSPSGPWMSGKSRYKDLFCCRTFPVNVYPFCVMNLS